MRTLKCSYVGCGTVIQMAGDTPDTVIEQRMADHVAGQHSSLETKHRDVLTAVYATLDRVSHGENLTAKEARELQNRVADLISKPRLAVEEEGKTDVDNAATLG